jgi:hypothetical protein
MKHLRRRKILELISIGRITAREGLKLLDALEEKDQEQQLQLEIISSRQETPYFQTGMTLAKLLLMKESFRGLKSNELVSNIQIGCFRIDLTKLNWQRILELAEIEEGEELFVMEMPGLEDEQIVMRISLKKT